MKGAAGFWITLVSVCGVGVLAWFVRDRQGPTRAPLVQISPTSAPIQGQPALSEFALVDQNGASMSSAELAGKVWAGSFFFALCPSTCYNQNIKLQQLDAEFADRGLTLVSITCDPANDSPAALNEYASRFHADASSWRFLTSPDADMDYIQRIGNDFFQLTVGPEFHSDRVVVFDREGKQRGSFHVLRPDELSECRDLLARLLGGDSAADP